MSVNRKIALFLYRACLCIGIIGVVTACSRKNEGWISRNFHAMGAYYNILYHGDLALERGVKQLRQSYVDDYWHILPLERIQQRDSAVTYGKMVDMPNNKSRIPSASANFSSFSGQNAFGRRNSRMNSTRPQNSAFGNGQNNRYNQNSEQYNASFQNPNYQHNNYENQDNIYGNQNNTYGNRYDNYGNTGGYNTMMTGSGMAGMNSDFSIGPQNFKAPAYRATTVSEKFERAEKKATKAIQKHSLLIDGIEYNPQMGHAYLLLGKARYYDQRYFPALQAFNYITQTYTDPALLAKAELWKGKVYLRLGNHERVTEKLTELLSGDDYNQNKRDSLRALNVLLQSYISHGHAATTINAVIEARQKAQKYAADITHAFALPYFKAETIAAASATLAQAYLDNDKKEEALKPLRMAIKTVRDNKKKGRYLFIEGQILDRLGKIDSANKAFSRVIDLNRRTPRIYRIHAYMEKADNFDYDTGNHTAHLKLLRKLQKDRENRPYLAIINYRLAEYFKAIDSLPTALVYYNKSLQSTRPSHKLKAHIYKTLGDYYFAHAHFKKAGAYYDSTMINLPKLSRAYHKTKTKRLSLNAVITYETIAAESDSILRLVHMPPQNRRAYFENYTDSLKAVAVVRAKKAVHADKQTEHRQNLFRRHQSQAGGTGFYFYNPARVAAGKTVFKRLWGERELQDNWRTQKGLVSNESAQKQTSVDVMAAIAQNPAFKVQTYIDRLPRTQTAIDSITKGRNNAYYRLGVIYSQKLEEPQLAVNKLKTLLEYKPEERLVLPAKYYLYKTYRQMGDTLNAEHWKQNLLKTYPNSRYAQIIRNPHSLRELKTSPEEVYSKLYKAYSAGAYQSVLKKLEEYIIKFNGDVVVPKMELLKAMIKGRLYGVDAYEKALNYVVLTYPQSAAGKRAQEIISEFLAKAQNAQFVQQPQGRHYLIYPVSFQKKPFAEELQIRIKKALAQFGYTNLSTSVTLYTPQKLFVVVSGLSSKKAAENLARKLKKEKPYQIDWPHFEISSANYEIVLLHKNLTAYLEQFEK